jgi:glycosidase
MHVILDFVVNHTSWDHPWIKAHPDWYQRNAAGEIRSPTADWTDVAQLDYTNRAMRSEMIRGLRWWVEQANVDGFRFDAAWNVPPDFFAQARMGLERRKPVFFLGEADDPAYHPMNDMTYAWDLPDLYGDIDTYLAWERRIFPAGDPHALHDQPDISHEESMQARYRGGVDAFAVVSNNLPEPLCDSPDRLARPRPV